MKENMVERHPMKSYLKPEEVADMAALLPQKKAKSISGQILKWIMELSASKYN
jgi:NAD(P)-dependent dehydrogenase (short-subunit alcohol dehydrogenase family)